MNIIFSRNVIVLLKKDRVPLKVEMRWPRLLIDNLACWQACGPKSKIFYTFKLVFNICKLSSENCENLYLFSLYLQRNKMANFACRAVCPKLNIFQQLCDRTFTKYLTVKCFSRILQCLILTWKVYSSQNTRYFLILTSYILKF